MEEVSKKHSQVPHKMGLGGLEPKDQLVYAIIKMYDNKNHEVFPSLQTVGSIADMSINSVRKSIKSLVDKGYMFVKKVGRQNYYTFSEYVEFEPFSPEFLKSDKISSITKAYVVASQQYMFKDVKGIGKISYSNSELSKKINMSESTIRRCNKELTEHGYMTILRNATKDPETGVLTDSKIFQLAELFQGIIWALNKHEDDIVRIDAEKELQDKRIEVLEKQIAELVKEKRERDNMLKEFKM